jgi:phospholipase/carboxylesterase
MEFAWFELDWQPGGPIPDQVQALESRTRLLGLLRELQERVGCEPEMLLAGFSQGAMMTLGVTLEAPELVRRIAMMSGAVLPAFLPAEVDLRLEGVPALVQHGVNDTVLLPEGSRKAVATLEAYGSRVRHVEYSMGHEVSYESLRDLKEFLVPE